MTRLVRRLAIPASESHVSVALALAIVVMSVLLWGVIWQADIITHQRQVIRMLWNGR